MLKIKNVNTKLMNYINNNDNEANILKCMCYIMNMSRQQRIGWMWAEYSRVSVWLSIKNPVILNFKNFFYFCWILYMFVNVWFKMTWIFFHATKNVWIWPSNPQSKHIHTYGLIGLCIMVVEKQNWRLIKSCGL